MREKSSHLRLGSSFVVYYREVKCPACSSNCNITGEVVEFKEPRLEKDEIIEERTILPTKLKCNMCQLELKGYESLNIVSLGSMFTHVDSFDPVGYYIHDVDLSDYFGEEYGNE